MPFSQHDQLARIVNRVAWIAALMVAATFPVGWALIVAHNATDTHGHSFLIAACSGILLSLIILAVIRMVLLPALCKTVHTLMDSEERFRALVQVASSAIIVLDHNGCVLEFNHAAEEFYSFHFERGDPVSAGFLTLLRFDDDNRDPAAAFSGTQNSESTFRTIAGDERTLLWTASRFTEGDGNSDDAAGLILLGQDITQRKKLEQALQHSEALLRLALDGADMGMWHWRPDNDDFTASAQTKQLCGFDPETNLSRRVVWDALRPEDRDSLQAALEQATHSGHPIDRTVQVSYPDGHLHWITWRGRWMPAHGEEPGRVIGVVYDVTQRKQLEAALIHAKQHAEQANQAKSEFLSMMSHELRSPMTGILGAIGLLLETPLENKQKEYAQIAHDSAWALLTLLNDILDVAKLEAGKITIESLSFSLVHVIEEVIHLMAAPAANRGLTLTAQRDDHLPPFLNGDAVRIRQILLNLIGNALKFTQTGGVTVHVSYDQNIAALKIAVTDTGIGISPEIQANLFQPFHQADSSISRKYGGTGLGLAICKQLCALMGGQIGIESIPNVGSTFWFTVCCTIGIDPTIDATSSPAITAELPRTVQPRHILIAEDSPINQMIIQSILSKAGHTLAIVNNGREAVEAISRAHFDLVLMDVQMPEMDGLRATAAIRALPLPQAQIPIIALTANAMREQRDEYLAAGMDDYVSKPFTEASLLGAIARLSIPSPSTTMPVSLGDDESFVTTKSFLEMQTTWHHLPIFNEAQLSEIGQSTGEAACDSLLMALSESMAENLTRLRAALITDDFKQAHGVAHRLKGEAGAFGAQQVATIAAFINDADDATDITTMRAAVIDLEQACHEAALAIEARVHSHHAG